MLGLTPLAHANSDCPGRDQLALLKNSDPALYDKLDREAAAIPGGESVFWRIDPPNGEQPSWLLGTVHLSDIRVLDLPAHVIEAIDSSEIIAVESVYGDKQGKQARAFFGSARFLVLPVGSTIFGLLGEKDSRRFQELVSGVGLDPASFTSMTPWLVAFSVAYSRCETERRMRGLLALDDFIADSAHSRSIEPSYLEDAPKVAELMASVSLDDQVAVLREIIDLMSGINDWTETSIAAWQSERPARLYTYMLHLIAGPPDSTAAWRRMEDVLVRQRNEAMFARARNFVDRGPAFLSAGYFHLFGEHGLVEKFRNAGYRMTPIGLKVETAK
ncbi:MAG: TraB/GumN family protein [Aestuariivirga sp.]